jgi:Amt family ammonium transporter
MKNLMDFCFAALGFFIFGYAIAYGGDGPLFGTSGWFMFGVDPATGTLPTSVFWLFQAVFAGTAATIVSGAMAERMRFTAYLMYSFLLTAFIYPVVAHWVWGGGWLASLDFHDFAGSFTRSAEPPLSSGPGCSGRGSGGSTRMARPT